PYGEIASRTGNTPTPFTWVGTLGYYKDSATRFYVRMRSYLANIGGWMTVDPLWPDESAYGYVDGRGVDRVDPTGLATGILPGIIGGSVGAGLGAGTAGLLATILTFAAAIVAAIVALLLVYLCLCRLLVRLVHPVCDLGGRCNPSGRGLTCAQALWNLIIALLCWQLRFITTYLCPDNTGINHTVPTKQAWNRYSNCLSAAAFNCGGRKVRDILKQIWSRIQKLL
ncbi:hypothetical protein QM565_30530, partial [Geitlerinema splendidum]|nr:hypothetical protein [Geitlerinema splendidum]